MRKNKMITLILDTGVKLTQGGDCMRRIGIYFVCVIFLIFLSGCSDFDDPLSLEQVRESALSCFREQNDKIRDIVSRNLATDETDWCKTYYVLPDGRYEFLIYRWGFTGTNIKAGTLYLPDDMPEAKYIQDTSNKNIYIYTGCGCDKYYLERIEENWFYFYDKYDF